MKRCIRKSEITKKTLKVNMTITNTFTTMSKIRQWMKSVQSFVAGI